MLNDQVDPILGIIPAKGASQRLLRKNIALLGGKPLLEWTVTAAKESSIFDRIVVSTEDQEIATLAEKLLVDVPFMRPSELAYDPAGVVDVALHALEELEQQGEYYKTLVIMLPTCPFRRPLDIISAMKHFVDRKAKFLMSVSPYDHTPFAALNLDNNGILSSYFPKYIGKKSQELPVAYRPNGVLHILDISAFKKEKSYYAQPLIECFIPPEYSIDIDTNHDLRLAEAMVYLGEI